MGSVWDYLGPIIGGLVLTIAARLIDRWLPDPEDKHPLPPLPPATPPKRGKHETPDAAPSDTGQPAAPE